jgi:Restriction endonuclease S subunits
MINWVEVELGSIIETLKGNAFKSSGYTSAGVPIIRATDFTEDSISSEGILFYDTENAKSYIKYQLKHWDILIQTVGSWQHNPASIVGKVVRVPKLLEGGLLNQNIVKIIPSGNVDNQFLYYRLKDESFKFYNLGCAQGAANQASITLSSIRAFKIHLPPLSVQRRIASILSAYDDLIVNNLERIKLLEELAYRTYEEWFVKFRINGEALQMDERTELPVGWKKKKLMEILVLNYGKALKAEDRIQGTVPVYGSSGVIGFHNLSIVQGPGIVVGRKGNVGSVFWSSKDFFPIDTVYFVTSIFSYYFLYFNLKKQNFINNDAAVPGLNRNAAYMADSFLPTSTILSRFDKLVKPFFDTIEKLQAQNGLLKEARDILLPRLMNGSINVEVEETKPATKNIQLEASIQKQSTPQFKEAILISLLTAKFGSEKYPLGRMRYTKLSYLFHRHVDNQIKDYLRKAAGPYNPKTKYGGPEKIAHDNGYVIDHKNGQLTGFIAGPNINEARPYFEKYWNIEYLTWLEAQFKYKSNDDLELFSTIDNCLIELNKKNEPFTVEAVKDILKKEPEWTAKLEREIFNDVNILRAVTYLPTIFQY